MKQILLTIGTVLLGVTITLAAEQKTTEPPPPDPVLVQTVDTTAKTISIGKSQGDPETFTVNAFTSVYVNGKSAKLEEVQPGMRVAVVSRNGKTAARIDAETYFPKVAKKK